MFTWWCAFEDLFWGSNEQPVFSTHQAEILWWQEMLNLHTHLVGFCFNTSAERLETEKCLECDMQHCWHKQKWKKKSKGTDLKYNHVQVCFGGGKKKRENKAFVVCVSRYTTTRWLWKMSRLINCVIWWQETCCAWLWLLGTALRKLFSKLFLKKHRKKNLAAKLSAQKNQANDADSKPLHSIFYLILAVFSKFIFFQWKPHGYSILTILT